MPEAAAPFYHPTSNGKGFRFLYVLANTCDCLSLSHGRPVAVTCTSLLAEETEQLFTCVSPVQLHRSSVYPDPLPVFQLDYLSFYSL